MPKLDTSLHLDMLRTGMARRKWTTRLRKAVDILLGRGDLYGLEWGDPETWSPLIYVRDHFLLPFVSPDVTALEIGPGGGRWTRYLLGVRRLYAVDYHQELLDELRKNFRSGNLQFLKNNGTDFPGVTSASIDFIFSFGTFVHLDVEIIDAYLGNMKALLKPSSNVVIQYSDRTKPMGKANPGFSENTPETMRRLVQSHGYSIREEDTMTLWHSSVIRFGLE